MHPQQPDYLEDEASRRRDAWLNEPFRCKAISTTKLRGCKFEWIDGGHSLKFQVSDVVCEDVEFDASGNPSRLIGCVGPWLRVPRNNTLKKAKRQDVWSGSHRRSLDDGLVDLGEHTLLALLEDTLQSQDIGHVIGPEDYAAPLHGRHEEAQLL